MFMFTSGHTVILKEKIEDVSHVRCGLFNIQFWVSDYESVRRVRSYNKPNHLQNYTISELQGLLSELIELKQLHKVTN
jgi:hypothetical protein